MKMRQPIARVHLQQMIGPIFPRLSHVNLQTTTCQTMTTRSDYLSSLERWRGQSLVGRCPVLPLTDCAGSSVLHTHPAPHDWSTDSSHTTPHRLPAAPVNCSIPTTVQQLALLFSRQNNHKSPAITHCVMLDQLIDVAMSTVIIPDVCMYVIFIRCDGCTSNNKHKKQSQNGIQYKAAKPKTISLHKAI